MFNCVPPEQQYPSYAAAVEARNLWERTAGVHFVEKQGGTTCKNRAGQKFKTYWRCKRHGKRGQGGCKVDDESRVKHGATSKKTGCPVVVILEAEDRSDPANSTWILRHHPQARFSVHNHPRDQPGDFAPIRHRTITEEQDRRIRDDKVAAVRAHETLAAVKYRDPQSLINAQDVRNKRRGIRAQQQSERGKMEQLFHLLDTGGFKYRHRGGDNRRTTYFLAVHTQSLLEWLKHPEVLQFDSTYATNVYKRPLLNIISKSPTNRTIQLGYALMPQETTENFLDILGMLKEILDEHDYSSLRCIITDRDLAFLNAVERTFPEIPVLICRWHLNKDVEAYMKGAGDEWRQVRQGNKADKSTTMKEFLAEWYKLLDSPTERELNEQYQRMKEKVTYEYFWPYFEREWMPHRHRFITCYTKQVLHFGEQTTSRIEGAHSGIKTWLKTSQLDIVGVLERFQLLWVVRQAELQAAKAQSRNTPSMLTGDFWSSVTRKVHLHALRTVKNEYDKAARARKEKKALELCTDVFRRVYGMPCAHEIFQLLEADETLIPRHFDTYWHIDGANPDEVRPREPLTKPRKTGLVFNGRDRHLAGRGENSTQRALSRHELSDGTGGFTSDANSTPGPPPSSAPASVAGSSMRAPSRRPYRRIAPSPSPVDTSSTVCALLQQLTNKIDALEQRAADRDMHIQGLQSQVLTVQQMSLFVNQGRQPEYTSNSAFSSQNTSNLPPFAPPQAPTTYQPSQHQQLTPQLSQTFTGTPQPSQHLPDTLQAVDAGFRAAWVPPRRHQWAGVRYD